MDVWPLRFVKGAMASCVVSGGAERHGRRWCLTDSSRASSSVCLKRLEPLCCFLLCWVPRGVDDRVEEPVAVPRCWPKKLVVLTGPGWPWTGETGPEAAAALDEDDATGGGMADMDMAPNQGSTPMTMMRVERAWSREDKGGDWRREFGEEAGRMGEGDG